MARRMGVVVSSAVIACLSATVSAQPSPDSVPGSPELASASAAHLITHATGFRGMAEAQVLEWLYQGIVGATAEGGTLDFSNPDLEGNLPQGVSSDVLEPAEPDPAGSLRLDLRDSWMRFSVVERLPGASAEVEIDRKDPMPHADRLYRWNPDAGAMERFVPKEDEGYHHCQLVLTVTPEGNVEARIDVYVLAFFRIMAYSWDLVLEGGTRPPTFRLGNYTSRGALGVF